jgi:hypothetical protein
VDPADLPGSLVTTSCSFADFMRFFYRQPIMPSVNKYGFAFFNLDIFSVFLDG